MSDQNDPQTDGQMAPPPWATPAPIAPPADDTPAPEAETAAPEAPVEPAVVQPEPVTTVVEDEVTVTVPKKFTLRLDHDKSVEYAPGVQQMPRSHAEHWWSKANKVEIYQAKPAQA